MKGFTAIELLLVWEQALGCSPAERALVLLGSAEGASTFEELAALPLGVRDGRLRMLREATFGPEYHAVATCPSCETRLELRFHAADFPERAPTPKDRDTWRAGDYTLQIRPLDSTDLVAVAGCADLDGSRRLLAERCVVSARLRDTTVPSASIPEELLPEMSAWLEALDPDAEVTLEAKCAACGAQSDVAFDVAAFLWSEIEAEALRLLRDVDSLARGYGWSEAEILGMSPLRRRAYLELAQS